MSGRFGKQTFWVLGAMFLVIGSGLQFAMVPYMSRLVASYERVPQLDARTIANALPGSECFVSARVSANAPAHEALVAYVKEHYVQKGKRSEWSVIESHLVPIKIEIIGASAEASTVSAVLEGDYTMAGVRILEGETNVRYRGVAVGDAIGIHGVVRPGAGTTLVGKQVSLGTAETIIADQRDGLRITKLIALGALAIAAALFVVAWIRRAPSA